MVRQDKVALLNQLAKCIVNDRGKKAYDALLDEIFAFAKIRFGNEKH